MCSPRPVPASMPGSSTGAGIRPDGQVDAGHRQAVERRLDQRLLIDPTEGPDSSEIILLGADQRVAERNRAGALSKLRSEQCVQLGAVGEEVGVGVLISGAGDQDGSLLGHRLRPVEPTCQAGYPVGIEEVVAGVTSGADDQANW